MKQDSKIVTIESFYSKKLDNTRKIYVYLPPSYNGNLNKRYPVLYMHAGQRLFDPVRENDESWNVHKTVDLLIDENLIHEIIIVGIAHKRIINTNEYCHFISPDEHIQCSGLLYEEFIVNELKPYIDSNFRTLNDPENTALIGSSAGGLSTYHIGFRRSNIFGKVGILSPFFVKVNDFNHSEQKLYMCFNEKKPLKIYIDIGGAEGMFLVRHVREVIDYLLNLGYKSGEDLIYYHDQNSAHFEKDWGKRVHIPIIYFFGNIGKVKSINLLGGNIVGIEGVKVNTNPIITYESGFIMTDVDGQYMVEQPDVLEIKKDGTIIPKKKGSTLVTYLLKNLKISKTYTVVSALSDFVKVTVTVTVPENTPDNEHLYMSMGMILDKVSKNYYVGKFTLPRGLACEFKFTRGFRKFEVDKEGNHIPNRKFEATHDLELNYTVENWGEL